MKQALQRALKPARFALVLAAAATVPALAAETSVKQAGQVFAPATLNIHVGDTVKFVNDDTVTHNVTIKPAGSDEDAEDLGLQKPGTPVSYKFAAKGAYRIICSIHPRMKMSINVQ